jgi:hypothetical protein
MLRNAVRRPSSGSEGRRSRVDFFSGEFFAWFVGRVGDRPDPSGNIEVVTGLAVRNLEGRTRRRAAHE